MMIRWPVVVRYLLNDTVLILRPVEETSMYQGMHWGGNNLITLGPYQLHFLLRISIIGISMLSSWSLSRRYTYVGIILI